MEQNEQMVSLLTNVALQAVREFSMMQKMDVSSVKPDFTTYKGSRNPRDVFAFLAKIDQNLRQKQVEDDLDKINYFIKHLEGDAQIWWARVARSLEQEGTYECVVRAFKEAFLDANYDINYKRKFKGMRQFNSVADYVRDYRELMRQFPPGYTLEDLFKDFFLLGLKPNVQAQVRALEPANVDRAMVIALEVGSAFGSGYGNSNSGFNKAQGTKSSMANNHFGPAPMDIDEIKASNAEKYANHVCNACGKLGHIMRICPLNSQGQSN